MTEKERIELKRIIMESISSLNKDISELEELTLTNTKLENAKLKNRNRNYEKS